MNKAKNHNPIDLNDWATPSAFFKHVEETLGIEFDLDVCATEENAKCERFFTPKHDGLAMSWECEYAWCNPPYGHGSVEKWLAKGIAEFKAGNVARGMVFLVPATPDTQWFHKLALQACRLWFIVNRLYFVAPDGTAGRSSHPSMLVQFDQRFAAGMVETRIDTIQAIRDPGKIRHISDHTAQRGLFKIDQQGEYDVHTVA